MHSYFPLKKWINILFLISIAHSFSAKGQTDSLPYISYRMHPIVFGDVGFSTAPATIHYPYNEKLKTIHLVHNHKMMMGVGFSYRWFALRIAAALVGNSRSVAKFGKSNNIDLGTQFSIKRFYTEFDLRNYNGYVLKNAYNWDSTYNHANPNDKSQEINVYNFSAKTWYLHNKHFRIDPFNGNRGEYTQQVMTWYLAGRVDIFGLTNKHTHLIPNVLHSVDFSPSQATKLSALEFGIIPGYGYVNNFKRFQIGFMFAFGPRMQFKTYTIKSDAKTKFTIVPRYDFKLVMGYSQPRYFVMAHLEVDNKSVYFKPLKYHQTFFYFKVQAGYRFKERLPKEKKKRQKV